MTNHPNRSKHQRGARCVYRDMTAHELDHVIDTHAELLAALNVALEALQITGYESRKHADALKAIRAAIANAEGR